MMKKKRRYQSLWEKIKTDHPKEVWTQAPPELHKRIIKAVRKEKSMDLAPSVRYVKLVTRIYKDMIGFKLEEYRKVEKLRKLL